MMKRRYLLLALASTALLPVAGWAQVTPAPAAPTMLPAEQAFLGSGF